jgi:cytochrome c oxidase subunit 5b
MLYVRSNEKTNVPFFIIEVKTEEDLLPPGGKPGTIPTDLEQATGLERLELLGKMQGIDIFDMRPLDASRKGTSI